jgi:hypothetical protein
MSDPSAESLPPVAANVVRLRSKAYGREQPCRWVLTERRLLGEISSAGLACLVRFVPACEAVCEWHPGDRVEVFLPGRAKADVSCPAQFASSFPVPQFSVVDLLPGGWPLQAGREFVPTPSIVLPIASAGSEVTLDLIIVDRKSRCPTQSDEVLRHLLMGLDADMRILSEDAFRMPTGPMIFIGDLDAIPIMRALLQSDVRNPEEERLFLYAAPEDMLRRWPLASDGTLPRNRLADVLLEAQIAGSTSDALRLSITSNRERVEALLDKDVHVVLAGQSESFLDAAFTALAEISGEDAMRRRQAAGRLMICEL